MTTERTLNNKKYELKECFGTLFVEDAEYNLLAPWPIKLDDWVWFTERVFLVTEYKAILYLGTEDMLDDMPVYEIPYHVVLSGTWRIELKMSEIWVEKNEN